MRSTATVRRARQVLAGVAVAVFLTATPAGAQLYARFAVPDSALGAALKASGAQFEPAWNALLVAELRATGARADSAARLAALERRIADAEPAALGSHVAREALALRARWTPAQRQARVRAAVAESLGAAANTGRDFARADSLVGAAQRGYQSLGERRRAAWMTRLLGSVSYSLNRMARADSLCRRALDEARAVGDARLEGLACNTLGVIHLATVELPKAWDDFLCARAARERIGDRAALGTTLNNLALIATRQGRADTALVLYRDALALTVANGDSVRTREVLTNYAQLLAAGRDLARARPLYERALRIAESRGDVGTQAEVSRKLGSLMREQGHFTDAIARLEQARALALAASNPSELRDDLIELGRAWSGLGDGARAREPLERAASIADSLGDRDGEARALNNLAIAARVEGDDGAARRVATRAVAAAIAAGDSSLVHDPATTLGEVALDAGDLATAEAWFTRAAATGTWEAVRRSGDVSNLGAVAARTGRLDDARHHFEEALALSEHAQSPDIAWPALLGLGDVAERRGDHATALAYDRQAAAMIEGLRAEQGGERPSMRLLGRRLFAFEALIHLLTRLSPQAPDSGYAAEAFHWSERARARAFLDLVAASGGEAARVQPLTLAEAQKRLHTDREAMLAYSVGDSSTSLWVITQRAWKHVALPPRRALRTRIEILRRGLADPASADAKSTHVAARALFATLIEPALPLLKGVDHLIVAPDGALALVPFEALLAKDLGDGAAPKGSYLVERWAVSYTPSASALATRRGAGGGGIVAVGNPTFAPDTAVAAEATPKLAPLPNTAQEVVALSTLAGKQPIVILTGREATRERWLHLAELSKAALVHIATHGEANEAEPERSGLWLAAAPGAAGPGFVSVADILGLRLKAGLVTLSACETGLGRLEGGEGVIGLSRAFLAAGSQSVMVSLWKVNDASTARLMERFYRGYLARDAASAASLADAKRAMLQNAATRSPFYWAPFVLIGNADKLGS